VLNRFHSRRRLHSFLSIASFLFLALLAPSHACGAGKPGAAGSRAAVATAPGAKQRLRHARSLRQRVESILARSEARRGFWGIEVIRLSDGKTLYSRFAKELFQPASNLKLFTTAAAIENLGPDFVFRTTVESDAAPDAQGRVADLVLVGRGDPDLSGRVVPYQYDSDWQMPGDAAFQELAEQVAAKGVREVSGDLILDDRYFLYEPYSHGWTLEDSQWGYAAPVTALAFNDNALRLQVEPGDSVGKPAKVWLEPIGDYYDLDAHVVTASPRSSRKIFVERACGSRQLDVWGEIPLGGKTAEDWVAVADPSELIGTLFLHALNERGIVVRGRVVARHLTRIEAAMGSPNVTEPPPRVVLAEHLSLPLRESIKVTNKASQNLHAEMLLRTLGSEVKSFGSLTIGLEVLSEFAVRAGITPEEVYFADGSGLSREDLVTPHAVATLLAYMARSPNAQAFYDTLPVAGADGTLAERFGRTSAEGRIVAKTGTLEHVNALSGYMNLRSGERLAFSILGNSHLLKSGEAIRVIDRIALAIFDAFSSGAGAR
jgi:D-alanyl-D-alanine carboxypeptidase/D-alanyl-D-alanine-endopeptidase (penicillin-binding protein 4)